jgi:hypothetical protein
MRWLVVILVLPLVCAEVLAGEPAVSVEAQRVDVDLRGAEALPKAVVDECWTALTEPKRADVRRLLVIARSSVSPILQASAWLALCRVADGPIEAVPMFLRSFPAELWCKSRDVPGCWEGPEGTDEGEGRYCELCELCVKGVETYALLGNRTAIQRLLESAEHSWSGCVDVLSDAMARVTVRRLSDVAAVWSDWARSRNCNSVLLLLGPERENDPELLGVLERGRRSRIASVRGMCRMLLAPLP